MRRDCSGGVHCTTSPGNSEGHLAQQTDGGGHSTQPSAAATLRDPVSSPAPRTVGAGNTAMGAGPFEEQTELHKVVENVGTQDPLVLDPTEPPTMGLVQFGQWLAEQQAQDLRDLSQQQQAAQATLVRELQQAMLACPTQGGGGVVPVDQQGDPGSPFPS
ncbi:UNVERIFIED_CONTAM: hypothetical protein K2H54_038593 [Gekko kuhli]